MILLTAHHKTFRYAPGDDFSYLMHILDGLPERDSLSRDDENQLAGTDKETLILSSMREAFVYAKRCCRGKLPDDEVYSACYEALCEAARNFKPGGTVRFFGYAKQYIRGRSGLAKVWCSKDVVRRGKTTLWEHGLIESGKFEYQDEYEGAEGITGVIRQSKEVLLPPSVEPDIDCIQIREEYALLQPMLKQLTDKEQSVISLRYRSGLTFERIGGLLGTSPADSQATHARALRKLRRLARQKLGTI